MAAPFRTIRVPQSEIRNLSSYGRVSGSPPASVSS